MMVHSNNTSSDFALEVSFSIYYAGRCMGMPPCFSTILSKGDNLNDFLFASTDNKTLSKWSSFLKKKNAPTGANVFFLLLFFFSLKS